MIDEVVSIKARDGTAIGLRIYRPGGEARVPSLFGASPYRFDISLEPQAYLFKVGHRIRLEIVNGDSPATEALWTHSYRPDKIGADTIYRSAERPSRSILPVYVA